MKKIFLLLVLSSTCFILTAQVTEAEGTLRKASTDTISGWKKGGVIGISLAQASFNNWAAGGQNSISVNGLVSVFANYKKRNTTWDNMLDLGYGLLQQGDLGLLKTDDKIDFSSKFGQAASKNWYYAALLNFKTQMTPGYNYPNDSVMISDVFAPAYMVAAIGMDYKPSDKFTAFIAPVTSKTTWVTNQRLADAGAFGVDPATYDLNGILLTHGKTIRNEFGGYLKIVYKQSFFKDKSVSLLSKLDLFSNYLHNPSNIDISWETIIGFKVNKFISATITTQLLYDDDINVIIDSNKDGVIDAIGPRTQFKEVLGIGFAYKF